MKLSQVDRISLDLSNFCTKACDFCYNNSSSSGLNMWKTNEVIELALDCSINGVKAFSFGGGEPFEYKGIFEIISALTPHLFVSVTSNGLPLYQDEIFSLLIKNRPDKIHLTIHNPSNKKEVSETIKMLKRISRYDIRIGINLFISSHQIAEAKQLTQKLYAIGFSEKNIIFVPRKFDLVPTAKEVAEVASRINFQSTSCLTNCSPSKEFCSISWDKKVGFCSFSPSKAPLEKYNYQSIMEALNSITFKTCLL